MTRTELEAVRALMQELLTLENKLIKLREQRDAQKSLTDIDATGVHANNISDRVGQLAAQISDYENMIEERCEVIRREIKRITKYIDGIDDPTLRHIVDLRCVDCKTWVQIGLEMKMPDTTCKSIYYSAYPKK